MSPTVRRNDPCPCGSGKKYKHCCQGEMASSKGEVALASHGGMETWKISLVSLIAILVAGGALILSDFARVGQILIGVGVLVLLIWAAFRKPPPPREDAGEGAAIDFGRK